MEQLSRESTRQQLPTERRRIEGDGSPRPAIVDEGTTGQVQANKKPFTFQLELDFMQIFLFIVAIATRTWQLGLPRAIVFDELHFAKFIVLYAKKIFFFDVHPPLGKMLLALAGSFTGFEGDASFDRIGTEYPANYPVYQLRLVPAMMGSLVVPMVYQICVELGLSRWSATLAAAFIVIDNALLVQSRFILMEGMMLFFLCLTLYSLLKFRHLVHREFSVRWWFWLCLTGVSFTCTLSIKYIGVFTAMLVLFLASKDFWRLLADSSKSDVCMIKHLFARVLFLLIVPLCIYIGLFHVHLSILSKAGPHDNIMTSAFQASLEGGLATLTRGQPLHVVYGSQITLRHTYDITPGRPCWLHSHSHVYPIRYSDGRGSSHQQQVTCYVFKDINNWWIVKDPNRNSMMVDSPPRPVRHGDTVQLVHGITSRALNSHDVAAPVTPQNQELSCYIDYNVSMVAQNLWRVEIVNKEGQDDAWQTIKSHIRLVHINSSQAVRATGKQLPEWGFHQLEAATDRNINQPSTIWNVEEHRYTKNDDKDQSLDLSEAELIPTEPTKLSFWSKFLELQYKMLFATHDVQMEHKYSSEPLEWPFMSKNVAYWMNPSSNAQIHLLGNPVIWCSATLALVAYVVLFVFYLMRRRRALFDLSEGEWQHFLFVGELLVGGYLLHYLPHFLTDRTLFLHQYIPCILFKVLALAAVIDHIYIMSFRFPFVPSVVKYVLLALFSSAVWAFYKLSVFSYGTSNLTFEEIQSLTWRESWDFLVHVRVQ